MNLKTVAIALLKTVSKIKHVYARHYFQALKRVQDALKVKCSEKNQQGGNTEINRLWLPMLPGPESPQATKRTLYDST